MIREYRTTLASPSAIMVAKRLDRMTNHSLLHALLRFMPRQTHSDDKVSKPSYEAVVAVSRLPLIARVVRRPPGSRVGHIAIDLSVPISIAPTYSCERLLLRRARPRTPPERQGWARSVRGNDRRKG